ncbi:MAG: hypothetical protein JW936_06055 [Sedimentisphaerales bacterium]|nr:hypothetical protein [Sedimentisphaerales bacterium]
MQQLFTTLSHAVEGSLLIAFAASFIWGILSVILSPCHLASIPLIVAFVDRQGAITIRRAFAVSSLFAVGILISIAIIGLITSAAGRLLGDLGPYANYFVALIFFLVGLHLLGIIPIPFTAPNTTSFKNKGPLAALILGLIFGIALGPCTFAYMAPVLAVSFKAASTNLPYAVALLLIYAIGHCCVIVLAGTLTKFVQRYLNWNQKSHAAQILKYLCAILIIIASLYLIYQA